eukprot:GHVN01021121.1.p1 GENE.GHVN01021121.1~~GHVN01021121.1.p1  ORF type:complete len:104 (+),score=2.07 GHVN01021121.1:65-376(+)
MTKQRAQRIMPIAHSCLQSTTLSPHARWVNGPHGVSRVPLKSRLHTRGAYFVCQLVKVLSTNKVTTDCLTCFQIWGQADTALHSFRMAIPERDGLGRQFLHPG